MVVKEFRIQGQNSMISYQKMLKKTEYLQGFEKKTKFWTQLIVLAKYVRHVQLTLVMYN